MSGLPRLLLAFFFTISPASAEELPRINWIISCEFESADKKPLPEFSKEQCDYIYTMTCGQGRELRGAFNGPNFTTQHQHSWLVQARSDADAAYAKYQAKRDAELARTKPSDIKCKSDQACLKVISRMSDKLWYDGRVMSDPFVCPKFSDSYVFGSPATENPYMRPFVARIKELDARLNQSAVRIAEQEKKRNDKYRAKLAGTDPNAKGTHNLKTTGDTLAGKDPRNTAAALNGTFDGMKGRAAAVKGPVSGVRGVEGGQAPGTLGGNRDWARMKADAKLVPGNEAAPIAGGKAYTEAGFFSRGTLEGVQRIKDDATVEGWHLTGYSRTVGDPKGKAHMSFKQKQGTCAIGAQAQALWARGDDTPIDRMVRDAWDRGLYKENATALGIVSKGTLHVDNGKLIEERGFNIKRNLHATTNDVERSVRKHGDAIVVVDARRFWNDSDTPKDSLHSVYVTGAEETKGGKILGYYVNDTGTGESARFVPKKQFDRSFRNIVISAETKARP